MGATGGWTGVGAGPSLLSVEQAGSSIRLWFDESMTDNADLRDPTHYTFTPLGGGDAVTTLSVTPGPGSYPSYVDLGISNPTTEGSSYQITADSSLIDAAGNPMDAGGLSINFLGFGSGIVPLDDLGILEALTGVFGEEMAEVGGIRMTRLAATVTDGDVTFHVESTLDWEESGILAVDGIKYYYTGTTDTSFTGISYVAAGASVAGAATDHRDDSAVLNLNRAWNALDLLRRGFLVAYAEGEDLNALGRNVGVERPPIFTSDDQFRKVIQAVAYNPKGTVLGLELALEALVGAGNYEVYENLIQYPNTVFIRVDTSTFLEATAAGRAFIGTIGYDDLGGTQDELILSEEPLAIGSVQLYPMDFLFDFRDDIPSDIDMAPWPGETPIQPWSYQGGESEGTAVVNTAGQYTTFTSSTGTVYYRMSDADGARVTEGTEVEISTVLNIPSTATVSGANRNQCDVVIEDGSYNIRWGVLNVDAGNYRVGLYDSSGWVGSTVDVAKDAFHEVVLRKQADGVVELEVDGMLIARQSTSDFDVSSNHRIEFGIHVTSASLAVQYKQTGVRHVTLTDYWNAYGAAGSVNVANPTRFDDTGSLLAATDVGKRLVISGSSTSNPQGGSNNGRYLVDSYVSAGVVELVGDSEEDGATVNTANPTRITVGNSEAFTYPDDLGKQIVISGSAGSNDGTYVIDTLLEPGTLQDYSTYDTPIAGAKTNVCEVVSATFTSEQDLEYQIKPVFVTEASLDWELSDAGSLAADTLTLRQSLWVNGLVMLVRYSNVYSAQLLADEDVQNIVGVGPTYDYWPFYLANPLGLVTAYMDDLTAAGVIPEFEAL